MRRLLIRVQGSTHPPYKLNLCPGTKVSDVLSYLNLTEEYVLSPLSDPQKHFTNEEELYDQIVNDEKLIAKTPVKIDIDKAREEIMKYMELNDDPPSEPMDTSEADAYILSFFKKKE